MNTSKLSRKYLESFKNRDIEALSDFFSDNISLRDWDISATGKDAVLAANQKIFDSFSSIDLEITNLIPHEKQVSVEFNLHLSNDSEKIFILVTDIIEFDSQNKIKSVRAYKGN